jgi:hypothetical protein
MQTRPLSLPQPLPLTSAVPQILRTDAGATATQRLAFWHAFLTWMDMASEPELDQLEMALRAQAASSFSELARAIQSVLAEALEAQTLPESLVQWLTAAEVACVVPRDALRPYALTH